MLWQCKLIKLTRTCGMLTMNEELKRRLELETNISMLVLDIFARQEPNLGPLVSHSWCLGVDVGH